MTRIKLTDLPNNASSKLAVFGYEHGVCVIRQGLDVVVYANQCPHMAMPMDWVEGQFLTADKTYIQCAVHGALFRKNDGVCVAGPCLGKTLQSVEFSLRDGYLIIG